MYSTQIDSLNDRAFLPKVSVVVPVYNGEADLPDLINCLRVQTYPVDRVEYLLVDNASTDRTATILQAAAQDLKSQGLTIYCLTQNEIQSSYATRNAGIRASTGEILVFTDADCRPFPNWLYALIQPFAHPIVGLVCGAIVALPGKTLLEKYAERKNILSHKFGLSHPFCPYAATANLAIRRQALEQVGLFRSYITTGGDVDLCWRIQRQSSWRLYCVEQAIVQHRHRATLQSLLNQFRRYGRSHQYLHELYGVDVSQNVLELKQYLYYLSRWLLKELPLTGVKAIAGKATFLDLLMTPIFLLTRQAHAAGRREAKLSEQARAIEWLEKPQSLNPDSTGTTVVLNSSISPKTVAHTEPLSPQRYCSLHNNSYRLEPTPRDSSSSQ